MEGLAESGLWGMLSGATLVVKGVLLLLASMSLISWTLIFMKLYLFTTAKRRAKKELETFVNAETLASAVQALRQGSRSSLYEIGMLGLTELKRLDRSALNPAQKMKTALDTLRRTLRQGVSTELGKLSNSLAFLATCANAAPFIGLFGTVWGIMNSFHAIGLQKTASLATVAPGISEALIATAIGLAVAIPATIAYNFFLGMLNRIEAEFVNFAGAFLNRVEREMPGTSSKASEE